MRIFLFKLFFSCYALKVLAQDVIFLPYYSLTFPTKTFQQTLPPQTFGLGIGSSLGISLGYESSFFAGADINYNIYGKTVVDNAEKRKVARHKYDPLTDTYVTDSVMEDVDFIINNNILTTNLFLRWRPQWKTKIVPYLDIFGGGIYLYTRSKLRADAFNQLNKNTYASSLTYSYGFGAGLNIMLGKSFGIDAEVKYTQGGRAKFIAKEDITLITKKDANGNEYTTFEYRTRHAPITMITGNIGFVFYFE
ncbi:MAG: hypothetical protein NZM38_01775 [Cytophagales bacterium]|nr:hypothetical protein [Cytophagales bacterium]MDW8383481.1 hypothetical protein [Flammeovirgaceae bacterium]